MKKPLGVAVFLCLLLLGAHGLYFSSQPEGERGILGGPVQIEDVPESILATPAALASPLMVVPEAEEETIPAVSRDDGFWVATLKDFGETQSTANIVGALVTYTVKKGDTLSEIAGSFGISLDSLVGANPGLRTRSLSIGLEIKVPTVSGAIYEVREGDTLESIAEEYGVAVQDIRGINHLTNDSLLPGISILVPGVQPKQRTASAGAGLPSIPGYFIQPATGHNWGTLHPHNAVDIANSCGTPIVASAEGLVVPDKSLGDGTGSWNGGYGRFVLVEHPNETKTRYAHLSKISVSIGDYVKQGQEVGIMGNTGNTHGPSGCHLHFEVMGARNPFAK